MSEIATKTAAMGGMSDLAIDVSEVLCEIHARSPRPSWESAVAEACAHEYSGSTLSLVDDEDEDGGASQIKAVMECMIGRAWEDEWPDDDDEEKSEGCPLKK